MSLFSSAAIQTTYRAIKKHALAQMGVGDEKGTASLTDATIGLATGSALMFGTAYWLIGNHTGNLSFLSPVIVCKWALGAAASLKVMTNGMFFIERALHIEKTPTGPLLRTRQLAAERMTSTAIGFAGLATLGALALAPSDADIPNDAQVMIKAKACSVATNPSPLEPFSVTASNGTTYVVEPKHITMSLISLTPYKESVSVKAEITPSPRPLDPL